MRNVSPPYVLAIAYGLLAIGISLAGKNAQELLVYDRAAILDGQVWRLVTAHWCHLNHKHLLINLGSLAVIWLLFGNALTVLQWLVTTACIALGITLLLLVFHADVAWYLGLSGLQHGFVVVAAMASLRSSPLLAIPALAIIGLKLAAELAGFSGLQTDALVGAPVLVVAHGYGAALGAAALLTLLPRTNRER